MFVAFERNAPVGSPPVDNDSVPSLLPMVDRFVDKRSSLKTDDLHVYKRIGKKYASHQRVNHQCKEYSHGDTHNNTAESFNAMLEQAKQSVFQYLNEKHLYR